MAHLDTGGYAPVLILGDAEWLTVRAVAAGGRVPDDRVARRLRRSGILDDDGIAPQAAPALHGAAGATRHLDVARFEGDGSGRRVEAWTGPRRATLVKHEQDGFHVYGLDDCEVPSAFAQLLDIGPRYNVDLGPRVLPERVYGLLDSGDLDALAIELEDLARRLDQGAEPGELGGPTPLTEGFAHRTWTLSLISTEALRADGWELDGALTTLSVPECLYELLPRSVADALDSGAPPEAPASMGTAGAEESGEPEEMVLAMMTSLELWARVSTWFFAA